MGSSPRDAHLALRLASFAQHQAFVPSPRAAEHMAEYLDPIHAEGTVSVHEVDGRVAGVLAWRDAGTSWYGVPTAQVALDYEPAAPGVEDWLRSALGRELPRMRAEIDLLLDPRLIVAFRVLREHGLGVDSLQLHGDPVVAREHLASPQPVEALAAQGLSVAPLQAHQVDTVLELQRAAFEAHPEYCWFGANAGFLSHVRKSLQAKVASRDHLELVLLADGEPVGHVSGSVDPDNAFWGPTAGMLLVLAPHLRGRGLARPLYRLLLDGMLERGARTFKGGTSQPPVIRLAAEMRRPLAGLLMRRAVPFDDAWFAPYLPL